MRERLVEVFQKQLEEGKQLQVITDAKEVDRSRLDASQCYIQITYAIVRNQARV